VEISQSRRRDEGHYAGDSAEDEMGMGIFGGHSRISLPLGGHFVADHELSSNCSFDFGADVVRMFSAYRRVE
jgi:hypothetical protein